MTGVLPITLEESRKISQVLLHSSKEYVCVMKLHGDIEESKVKEVLGQFEDAIYQRPPLRSSVKRQLRIRRIYYIDFLEMKGRNVLFKVGCEGGTYIRKLCYDVGEIAGCGAHMQELRRTRSGPFVEEGKDFVTLHGVYFWFDKWKEDKKRGILQKFIQPMENGLALIPKIYVRDSAVDAVCHGANLTAPGVLSIENGVVKGSMVAIQTLKGETVALASATLPTMEVLEVDHGTVAVLKRVLMPRSTYPKVWKSG